MSNRIFPRSPLPILMTTFRQATAAALYELAGILSVSEHSDRYPAFAQVHRDDIMRVPESTLGAIALGHGCRVVLLPRPGTGIIEMMSEDTYLDRYQRDIDILPHQRRPRLKPIWKALAEGFTALAGGSSSSSPKP